MLALCIVLLNIFGCFAQEEPIVDTEYGQVQGTAIELHNGIIVNSFYGIPFAEPPIGGLRFRDPLKLQTTWEGVKDAVELPTSCMQTPGGTWWLTHPLWNNFDEDCLTLNVFTPENINDESHAVMVWLHGGAFQSSGNIQYPGHFLAMKNVVMVVPNYRVGNLGFAYTGDENAPGNAGLKDQILALEWVRDNIANFGGDPNRVTIFGQSAGGASVGLMLMSPLATGLFHRAILQSGSEMAMWAVNVPNSNPENYVVQVAEQQECPTDDTAEMMDCLRGISARSLVRTEFNCTEGWFCFGMAPVVDGPNSLLPDTPRNIRLNGTYNKVPEISMFTTEDGMVYALALLSDERWNITEGFTREEFIEVIFFIASFFHPALPDPTDVEDLFQALLWFYSPWPDIRDMAKNRDQVGQVMTDLFFGYSADLQVKDHSDSSDTYFMTFGYKSDGINVDGLSWLGTYHSMDLPYVLGFPYLPFNPAVRNNSGIIFDILQYTSEDREYFEFISDMWTHFAKTGNPTPYPVSAPGDKGEVTWDRLNRDSLKYMYVDNEFVEVRQNYRQKEFAFWREYLRCMNFQDLDVPGSDTSCTGVNKSKGKGSGVVRKQLNAFQIGSLISSMLGNPFGDNFIIDEDN